MFFHRPDCGSRNRASTNAVINHMLIHELWPSNAAHAAAGRQRETGSPPARPAQRMERGPAATAR
eukprot:391725-Karenia_brevis.AAC.1